ncbi:MAG: hypothetical protein O2865_08320 [Planctomycetota bacterium]|nr:hypothetical protein [Planctomycetota bacterium]MDA0933442.1 hypothetical protein [Planctomycetota bacterium]MDA1222243.1 hypothetical protein [Planctomycetota bacterium]
MSENFGADATSLPRRFRWTVAVVFTAFVSLGPVLQVTSPAMRTRAAKPWPAFEREPFLDGTWATEVEDHLRETSPWTIGLRGVAAEALEVMGRHEVDLEIGRAGMIFAPFSMFPNFWLVKKQRADRIETYREVSTWLAERNIELICVPVPDKVRIESARLSPGRKLSPEKLAFYDQILAELREGGIEALDVARSMHEWRRAEPEVALYHERDTHWTSVGAWRTALLIARAIAAEGWLEGAPRAPVIGTPANPVQAREDLAAMCGFLENGLFRDRIFDTWAGAGARIAGSGAGVSLPLPREVADAPVAVCGDSFAEGGLAWTLPLALGVTVDSIGAQAAKGPLHGLVETLRRIDRGELRPRIVVWEFIERSVSEDWWVPRPDLP